MSEKIADDYGLTQLLAYLKAHAYTGGTNGTFALATDSDMDAVLTTGESNDWTDNQSLKKSIGYYSVPAWPSKGICNYVHVPGNSIIFEYMRNTEDFNIGQNGAVSGLNGSCNVPYYLDSFNKEIWKTELNSTSTTNKANEIKAQYDAHQATLNTHISSYTGSSNTSMFTAEDVEYVCKYAAFLGTSSSTDTSWTYVMDEVFSNKSSWDWLDWERYYKKLSGAIYNETKAREKIRNQKLKNKGYFELLFGSFDSYISYLGGES